MRRILKDKTVKILAVCVLALVIAAVLYFAYLYIITIHIDSKEELLELMKAEVLDAEITDVKWKIVSDKICDRYSMVFVFLKEEGELEYMDYFYDKSGGGAADPELAYIPPGDIPALEEMGVSLQQIQKHGTNFGDIRVGFGGVTYYIEWFQIDDTYDGESNVLLLAAVPRRVAVDTEKILNSPDNGKKADAVVIDSREELAELMNVESLDTEITGVRCKETGGNYTVVLAFLKESGDLKEKLQYHDLELKYIPDVYISLLEEMEIGLTQIQDHWINYADIQAGSRKVQYHIDLFQLDDTYNGEGNVILMAGVPRRISVDADKILAPAQ